jgi:hypothetical protein
MVFVAAAIETVLRNPRTGEVRQGLHIHLTPTHKVRNKEGSQTKHRFQGRCKECGKKSSLICLGCDYNPEVQKEVYICDPSKCPGYWQEHVTQVHP